MTSVPWAKRVSKKVRKYGPKDISVLVELFYFGRYSLQGAILQQGRQRSAKETPVGRSPPVGQPSLSQGHARGPYQHTSPAPGFPSRLGNWSR